MLTLLLFGFALGLDSFRVSLGLGSARATRARRRSWWRIALAFGLCDGIAPLVGLMLGHEVTELIGAWTRYLGPSILGGYGLYAIYASRFAGANAGEGDNGWIMWGLPLTLSFDNFAAGVGLGMLAFPALLSATLIGLMSGLMSLAGLCLGGALGQRLPFKAELVGGVILVLLAVALALDIL